MKPPEAAPSGDARFIGISDQLMTQRRSPQIPELGVAVLRDVVMLRPHGWLTTGGESPERYVLPDASWFGAYPEKMQPPDALPEPRRISGTCVSLISDFANTNFGHFLLEAMPRLQLLDESGIDWRSADHILVPMPQQRQSVEILKHLQLDATKVIDFTGNQALSFESLVVTSFPGHSRTYPSWLPEGLRARFADREASCCRHLRCRRLYLSRQGYGRSPRNEMDVRATARSFSFEIIEPHKGLSIESMLHADVVLSPHGAGLANAAFAQPGATLVELIPTDHQFPYYYSLAMAGGLRYRGLGCASTEMRGPEAWGPSPHDFDVDLQALTQLLASLDD